MLQRNEVSRLCHSFVTLVRARKVQSEVHGIADMGADMDHSDYEVCFRSLFHEGRALSFPCDPQGQVDMDSLSETAIENYLFARAMVGREYATPAVVVSQPH
jgi:hypothetical protein